MLYCSERCRKQAYDSYHRIECQLWPFYSQQFSSMAFRMAVRTLLIGTEQGTKLDDLMNTLTIENIFVENNHPPVNDPLDCNYLTTLTLYRNFDETIMRSQIVNAVKTIIWLRRLHFFTNVDVPSPVSLDTVFGISRSSFFIPSLLCMPLNFVGIIFWNRT